MGQSIFLVYVAGIHGSISRLTQRGYVARVALSLLGWGLVHTKKDVDNAPDLCISSA